jgi:hypothetical protein
VAVVDRIHCGAQQLYCHSLYKLRAAASLAGLFVS